MLGLAERVGCGSARGGVPGWDVNIHSERKPIPPRSTFRPTPADEAPRSFRNRPSREAASQSIRPGSLARGSSSTTESP